MKDIKWRTDFKNEHDLQEFLVARLRHLGFRVKVLSSNIRGRRQHRGAEDFAVRKSAWCKGTWVHFETKYGKARFTDEQEIAVLNGDVIPALCWRDITDALGIPYIEQLSL